MSLTSRRALGLTALMVAATLPPASPSVHAASAAATHPARALVAAPVAEPRQDARTPAAPPSRPVRAPRADRTRRAPNFAALAQCESSGNPRAVSPNGLYGGLYQFDQHTWESVGGQGDPAAATPTEQTRRAWLLYTRRGTAPWPVCGRHL